MENDLAGRLVCFTLSDIIQMLSFSQQTGTLTLSQGWNTRTITFEHGRLTYIAAATKLASVEELLLKAGRISQAQLAKAIDEAELSASNPSDTLLSQEIVDEDDIRRCREQQLEETIYSLFLWRNCHFTFQSGVTNKEGGIPVDIAGERLIMESTRRVDEWIAISPVIPSIRMIYQVESAKELVDLPKQARDIFCHIDGARDVAAIAQAAGLTQFDTAKALFELVRRGLVRAVPPDKVRIIELFKFLVEGVYVKLLLYGHSRIALEFQNQLNRFALDHHLKTRMMRGKVSLSDIDLTQPTTALIDLYKLFIAIENNKFSKMFDQEIIHGLVEGLYLHVDARYQDMMRMYDFYPIEGLLRGKSHFAGSSLTIVGGRT